MQCPKCDYVMDDFTLECPRCARIGNSTGATQVTSVSQVTCQRCGTLNSVPEHIQLSWANCGKCGLPLEDATASPVEEEQEGPPEESSTASAHSNPTIAPILTFIIIVMLVLVAFKVGPTLLEDFRGNQSEDGMLAPSTSSPVVTLDEFLAVREGMSYTEVVSIIGKSGVEASRSHTEGVPGVMPDLTITIYEWVNEDGSNMNAMFENGKLVSKAQAGLE